PKIKIKTAQNTDTIIDSKHQQYTINKVFVHTFKAGETNLLQNPDTVLYKNIYIISNGKQVYRPEVIAKNLFVKQNELYSLYNAEYSYKRLAALKTFKIINI